MNIIMGFFLLLSPIKGVGNIVVMSILFSTSDFFQTFCTTAICKVGVYWYHISERGLYSGIFGIIIAFGFYLAFQVNGGIKTEMHYSAIFFVPGLMLAIFSLLTFAFVRSSPEDAGYLPVDEDALIEYNESHQQLDNSVQMTNITGEYMIDGQQFKEYALLSPYCVVLGSR
jgi:sugar phosphate permease